MGRANDPAWLAYRAERARIKADKAEAEAQELERRFYEALARFEREARSGLAARRGT
jgi:hypothetical protein